MCNFLVLQLNMSFLGNKLLQWTDIYIYIHKIWYIYAYIFGWGKVIESWHHQIWKILHSKSGICQVDIFALSRSGIFVTVVLKSIMNVFHWIVGGDHLLWELHLPGIPYLMRLLLLKLWEVLRKPFVVTWMKKCFISFS